MNSTHVVCQIVLGTMEKRKQEGLNESGCWWSFAISDRLIQKDLSLICWHLSRGLQEVKAETSCKYLGKEPPGDVKQGQGPRGERLILGRPLRWPWWLEWSRQEENGRTRNQRVNKGGTQRAGVYAGLWVTLVSVRSEPEDLLGCSWGAWLVLLVPSLLLTCRHSSEH